MATVFVYLIESSLCLWGFWGLYRFFLSETTSFRLNRLVLVGGTIACLLLPLVHVDIARPTAIQQPFILLNELLISPVADTHPNGNIQSGLSITVWFPIVLRLLFYIYCLGAIILLTVYLTGYWRLMQMIKRSQHHSVDGVTWCLVTETIKPFSWERYAIITETDFRINPLVALHERMHILHRHFVDNTLMQLVAVLHWFNPAVRLLWKELKLIHEYQVDRDVILQNIDVKQYQLLMVQKAVGAHIYAQASGFSQQPLKKRIAMMQKQSKHDWRSWLTLLLLPAGAGAVYAFSQPVVEQSISSLSPMVETITERNAVVSSTLPGKMSLTDESDKIYDKVQEVPSYPGGAEEMWKFLMNEAQYPKVCLEQGIQGRVYVSFVVEKDGSIGNVKVIRSSHEKMSEEAVRVVRKMKKWTPGRIDGKAVRSRFTLPIMFGLH